jgi:hypothetical protein
VATAVACVLILGLLPARAGAQTETVDLRVKIARGETVSHASVFTFQQRVQIGGLNNATEGRSEGRLTVRGLEVEADGIMVLEVRLEDQRLTVDGETEEITDAPWVLRVRPDGRVIDHRNTDTPVDTFPLPLPERPIRVGESWARTSQHQEDGITVQITETSTLTRVDRGDAGQVAHIRTRIEGTTTADRLESLPRGFEGRLRGTLRGTRNVEWSVDRGQLIRLNEEILIDQQVDVRGQGQTLKGTITIRSTREQEPFQARTSAGPTRISIPVWSNRFPLCAQRWWSDARSAAVDDPRRDLRLAPVPGRG